MIRVAAIVTIVVALIAALLVASAGSASTPAIQGDANCDGVVGPGDALSVLDAMAGVPLAAGACEPANTDTNCDGDSDGQDVLAILEYVSQQPNIATLSEACTPIGSALEATPTPSGFSTPTPTFTATPTLTPTPTVTPSLTPTPTPTLAPCPAHVSSSAARAPAGAAQPHGYILKRLPADADVEKLTNVAPVPNQPGYAIITNESG